LCFLTACNKDSSGVNDHVFPVINLQTPASGQVLPNGVAFHIKGTISDDQYISQAHVHVNNNTTGAELMDVHLYPNGTSASFDETFTPVAGITYNITIMATDRATNLSTTTVIVTCN
jgi:hypothetical protein